MWEDEPPASATEVEPCEELPGWVVVALRNSVLQNSSREDTDEEDAAGKKKNNFSFFLFGTWAY